MKCPICKIKLSRNEYEGVNIHQCEQCQGTLIKFDRLKAIESRRDKSKDDLMDEVVNAGEDTLQKLRCSHCLSNMEKRQKQIGSSSFHIDRCDKCKVIWLDKGELAKWQVVYEFSEKGEEAHRFKERLANMSPSEKAELEERIDNLPEQNVALETIYEMMTEPRGRGGIGAAFWF